jgi:uroporphyrinogen-III synthase
MSMSVGPLSGKTILVTRPKEQAERLLALIKEQGGIPLSFPVVEIKPAQNEAGKYVQDHLSHFDWVIFTSRNGVDHFFQLIRDSGLSAKNKKFAAVGEKTAAALERYGVTTILIPARYDAADLAETLKKHVSADEKILFPKGNLAPSFLKEELKCRAYVKELIVYETVPSENLDWSLTEKADCIFFMSPSAVSFLMRGFSDSQINKPIEIPVFCIGPTTKAAAIENGFEYVHVPSIFTADDMVKSAISYFQGGR